MAGPFAREIVAVLVAALVSVPLQAAARASGPDDPAEGSQSPPVRVAAVGESSAVEAALSIEAIRASTRRLASGESHRVTRSGQTGDAAPGKRCPASMAEKLAWIYALVGGSLLLVYGPQEKERGVWTNDGKSETVAGAVAIGLSFALLHDIRKKGRP
jgi:hypothetical protein